MFAINHFPPSKILNGLIHKLDCFEKTSEFFCILQEPKNYGWIWSVKLLTHFPLPFPPPPPSPFPLPLKYFTIIKFTTTKWILTILGVVNQPQKMFQLLLTAEAGTCKKDSWDCCTLHVPSWNYNFFIKRLVVRSICHQPQPCAYHVPHIKEQLSNGHMGECGTCLICYDELLWSY